MGTDYNFLGQNITVGMYVGWGGWGTISHCAILNAPVSFSILLYFKEYGNLEEDAQKSFIFKDSQGNNVFAIAYRDTSNYGYSTFVKYASSDTTISDDDMPNYSTPWGGWVRIASFDKDNITFEDILRNSFSIYKAEQGLYPYWNGSTMKSFSDQVANYGNINCLLITGLYEDDGSTPTTFTGATPLLPHDTGFTNWIDSDTRTDPSYRITGIYSDLYSLFDIVDVISINDFTDDTAVTGGGYGGDYGYRGDPFDFSSPLALNALDTGLITMFSPTKAQLRTLASFLWSDDFIDNVKKAWAEPMESIIQFGIVPIDLASVRENSASQVYVGNVSITGCQMYKLKKQVIPIDMGKINVKLNWTNALDWEPFCQCTLYLPYIGFVPIKVNDVMKSTIHLKYFVDLLSGDCIAQVKCMRDDSLGQKWGHEPAVLYQHRGNCMINIPISANNYSAFYKTLTLGALNAMGSAFTMNGGGIESGVTGIVSGLLDGADIQRSGNYSGSVAGLMHPTPCLFIQKPIQHMPENYEHFVGWPCYKKYKLGDLKGFTVVDSVIDNTVKATDREKILIEEALKEGIIL